MNTFAIDVPDIESDPITIFHNGKPYTHLSFLCPWGCLNRDGSPKRHIHGYHEPGEPLRYGGAASHCHHPDAPSSYELVPRKDDAA